MLPVKRFGLWQGSYSPANVPKARPTRKGQVKMNKSVSRQERREPSEAILRNENTELLPVTRQKVVNLCETLKREKLTPWLWFNSRGVKLTNFYGKPIDMPASVYGQSSADVAFFSFIVPFLQDAIVKTLDETLQTCRARGLGPEEAYIRETAALLDGYLIDPIYRCMATIDWRIRGKGNPKSVGRRDVTDEIAEMVKFLDKCKDEMIQGIKAAETQQNTAVAKEGKGDVNVNIFGDVQAGNLQIAQDASIHDQSVIKEKKRDLVRKALKIVGAIIVGIIGSLLADILCGFGWFERIKRLFTR